MCERLSERVHLELIFILKRHDTNLVYHCHINNIYQGGYCLKTLAEGAALSLRTLLGEPPPNIDPTTPTRDRYVKQAYQLLADSQISDLF